MWIVITIIYFLLIVFGVGYLFRLTADVEKNNTNRQALSKSLHDGQILNGVVKNITDYGVFIDLGGVEGFLHIINISWKNVKHPNELLTMGQNVRVKVLNFDSKRKRISLGMKQLSNDPWIDLLERYPIGKHLTGKVININDDGYFVEIEEGVEGLVPMSEMALANKNAHPSHVVSLGDVCAVIVLDIDEERRCMSLALQS